MKNMILAILPLAVLFSCNHAEKKNVTKEETKKVFPEVKKPEREITYSFANGKQWAAAHKKTDSAARHIVLAINRTDMQHIGTMDSILIPSDTTAAVQFYMPFPAEAPYLKDISKIIFFSYPAQAFSAYEYGHLVYTGPTNMGRKKDPTPTGLFYTNWKAEETTSTFNDEWNLKWNFNIENKEGVGFHQYALPGYPASHSCLRLLEEDAKYLYNWADQWKLKGTDNIISYGTPVVVFGSYDFGGPKPWKQLVTDPHALDISAIALQQLAEPHIGDIMQKQQQRENNLTDTTKK